MIAILISVILGAMRIAGNTSIPFQAIAHCWAGGLIGAWWAFRCGDREIVRLGVPFRTDATDKGTPLGWLALGLTILEVACAVWFKHFAG